MIKNGVAKKKLIIFRRKKKVHYVMSTQYKKSTIKTSHNRLGQTSFKAKLRSKTMNCYNFTYLFFCLLVSVLT